MTAMSKKAKRLFLSMKFYLLIDATEEGEGSKKTGGATMISQSAAPIN